MDELTPFTSRNRESDLAPLWVDVLMLALVILGWILVVTFLMPDVTW